MNRIDLEFCKSLLKQRNDISHKGDYGHLLLICGSKNMPGAAVLAVGAALHSGCGLVSIHSVESVCTAVSHFFPSAILSIDSGGHDFFTMFPDNLQKYNVVAIGPGLGQNEKSADSLYELMKECQRCKIRMLLDADALNILSSHRHWLKNIPEGSVMTPHLRELSRLTGGVNNAYDLARFTGCVVVSKGYETKVVSPSGDVYVNTTGGPGLAKGGSGDVLSGIISSLMARGYDTMHATTLGVWLHGYAGDCLTEEKTAEAFDSFELIGAIFKGFKLLSNY